MVGRGEASTSAASKCCGNTLAQWAPCIEELFPYVHGGTRVGTRENFVLLRSEPSDPCALLLRHLLQGWTGGPETAEVRTTVGRQTDETQSAGGLLSMCDDGSLDLSGRITTQTRWGQSSAGQPLHCACEPSDVRVKTVVCRLAACRLHSLGNPKTIHQPEQLILLIAIACSLEHLQVIASPALVLPSRHKLKLRTQNAPCSRGDPALPGLPEQDRTPAPSGRRHIRT